MPVAKTSDGSRHQGDVRLRQFSRCNVFTLRQDAVPAHGGAVATSDSSITILDVGRSPFLLLPAGESSGPFETPDLAVDIVQVILGFHRELAR